MTETLAEDITDAPAPKEGMLGQPRPVWLIALSVSMVLVGILALAFPLLSTLAVETFVGAAFVSCGIVTTIHAFMDKNWAGFFWSMAIGLLYCVAGIVLLLDPLGGVFALTAVLGATFVAEGILRIVLAIRSRGAQNWGLMIASGALSILLGGIVLAGLVNGSSLLLLGMLVGINFVFAGVSMTTIGMSLRTENDARSDV